MRDNILNILYWLVMASVGSWGIAHLIIGDTINGAISLGFCFLLWRYDYGDDE